MGEREIRLPIVGEDHTGRATKSAERNLDRLQRKTKEFDKSSKAVVTLADSFVGLASTIKAGGTYAAVAAIVAVIASLPAVGSLAAGGLVAALGGGLAALGLLFASRNEAIRREFGKTFAHIQNTLRNISKPFEPVLKNLAVLIRKVFDVFSPSLAASFQAMAPAVDRMFTAISEAVIQLLPTIGPVTDAFISMLDAIGPQLPGMVKGIADGIIAVALSIRKNPQTFASLIRFLAGATAATLRLIAVLSSMANWFQRHPNVTRALVIALTSATVAAGVFRNQISNALNTAASVVRRAVDVIKGAINSLPLVRTIKIALDLPNVAGAVRGILGALSPLPGFSGGGPMLTAPQFATAGASFAGGPVGGSTHVEVGPTNVTTTVLLDGSPFRALVRNAVSDDRARQAHRARYGRR
jgi:phage-related protein